MTQRARVIALDIETISETGVPASKYFGFLRFHWPETPGTDFVSITLSRPWKNDRVINLRSGFSTEQLSPATWFLVTSWPAFGERWFGSPG
jgi:hypothetical protein